jgi:N-acetyl-gamma-glutamyl-phosphate reductase
VLSHPELELVALGSDSLAGSPASVLDPRLNGSLPAFVTNDEALAAGAELVFCCLEHERAAALEPPADAVVVDLSGAHRLDDPALYREWYGFEHPAAGSLGAWSYAIPELFPPEGPLIANPGCYATAVLLALAPLVDSIDPVGIVVDAKSGVSGAGRTLTGVVACDLGARERLAVQGRLAPACPGDRTDARLPRSASSRTCCP